MGFVPGVQPFIQFTRATLTFDTPGGKEQNEISIGHVLIDHERETHMVAGIHSYYNPRHEGDVRVSLEDAGR
jgi:hypothetical protein